jgi:hypothetical protein
MISVHKRRDKDHEPGIVLTLRVLDLVEMRCDDGTDIALAYLSRQIKIALVAH